MRYCHIFYDVPTTLDRANAFFQFDSFISPSFIDEHRRAQTRENQRGRAARYAEKIAALREAAKTDPEAAAQYERIREGRREAGRRYRQRKKEAKLVSET